MKMDSVTEVLRTLDELKKQARKDSVSGNTPDINAFAFADAADSRRYYARVDRDGTITIPRRILTKYLGPAYDHMFVALKYSYDNKWHRFRVVFSERRHPGAMRAYGLRLLNGNVGGLEFRVRPIMRMIGCELKFLVGKRHPVVIHDNRLYILIERTPK